MTNNIHILLADKLNHYKKGVLSGSFSGMRYFIQSKQMEDESLRLSLWIWPEPYAFNYTEESLKENYLFPFTEEGLADLEVCLNEKFEEKKEFWKKSVINPSTVAYI